MKISYSWLQEFVDIPVDAQTLGQRITHVGLALESLEERDGGSVLDLDVTTNRPDCLNHLGVARGSRDLWRAVPKTKFSA